MGVCIQGYKREMMVCKQEVCVVPKWKPELGLLVNICKHGATASKPQAYNCTHINTPKSVHIPTLPLKPRGGQARVQNALL
jgi:hypothetical protein